MLITNNLKQTNSIKGEHVEPQATPPMSEIYIVSTPLKADIMAQLPNHLIMDIIRQVDGGLNTHKQKFKSVISTIEAPLKFHEEFDGEWFGHFEKMGDKSPRSDWYGHSVDFWLNSRNICVEDPVEIEQFEHCGLYEVLGENYRDNGSILAIWG